MKRLLALTFICLATIGTASAEWKKVTYSDAAIFYVETSTIRTNRGYKEGWVMADLTSPKKAADGKMYLSTKSKYRFDCAGDKINPLAIAFYSGNMGGGEVIWSKSFNDNDWEHNAPDSVGASFSRAVCGR